MKGKLKQFDSVINSYEHKESFSGYKVWHSCGKNNANLGMSRIKWPEHIVTISRTKKRGKDRTLYNISGQGSNLYYDEWFEWVGEEPEILPEELWDIGDW